MSLIFVESFDVVGGQLPSRGYAVSSTGDYSIIAGRTGNALKFNDCNQKWADKVLSLADVNHSATLTMGFAWAFTSANPSGLNPLIKLYGDSGGTLHFQIIPNAGGTLGIYRGGTLLGTTTYQVPISTWVYIEVQVILASSATGTIEVRVNNTTVFKQTGIVTSAGGTNQWIDLFLLGSQIGGAGSANYAQQYDDMYVCDGSGSRNNTFLGDIAIRMMRPSGNGDKSQFTNSAANSTNNYSYVNGGLQTATYVQDGTVGDEDSYAMSQIPANTGKVVGVQTFYYAAKTDTGARAIVPLIREGGVDYADAATQLSTSAGYFGSIKEVDPATSAPWTAASLNAAQLGHQVG